MDVPEWLIAEAKTERMVAHMRSIMSGGDGDWDMATDADAIIHLYQGVSMCSSKPYMEKKNKGWDSSSTACLCL